MNALVRLAARAGVLVAAGTDFGGGSLRAGQLAWEVECLVTAGLEPWQALAAATRNGRQLLGEPDAGVIREGGPADLVFVHGDPLSDPAALWRLNLICFAACIEGLFFYGAFAYVYFLRSRGLLNGLASGTNWVFRDESMHMAFAFDVVDIVRSEEPELFDARLTGEVRDMLAEAVECEVQFAADLLGQGLPGLSLADMREYLQHVADRRLGRLGIEPLYGSPNPLAFMELQDVQELSNFFERRVSAYQVGVTGTVAFDHDF